MLYNEMLSFRSNENCSHRKRFGGVPYSIYQKLYISTYVNVGFISGPIAFRFVSDASQV